MADFPIVTVTDSGGDGIEISVAGGNVSIVLTDGVCVTLGPDEREAFAQAYIAACHEADRQAGGGAAPAAAGPAPRATGGADVCMARHPGKPFRCTAAAGHAPLDHAAYTTGGRHCISWPVQAGAVNGG